MLLCFLPAAPRTRVCCPSYPLTPSPASHQVPLRLISMVAPNLFVLLPICSADSRLLVPICSADSRLLVSICSANSRLIARAPARFRSSQLALQVPGSSDQSAVPDGRQGPCRLLKVALIAVNRHVRRILRRFASSQITAALQIAAALQMAAVLRAALLSWAARDWAA
jgi:hypothetical protein